MIKNKIKLRFIYDPETRMVSDCNLTDLSVRFASFVEIPEVTAVIRDMNGFSEKRLKDYLETGTPLNKEFVSRLDGKTYVADIKKREDKKLEFTLIEKQPVWAARRSIYVAAITIVVAIVLVCILVMLALRSDMKKKKTAETQITIRNLSDQIDDTISTKFNSWFNELKVISSLVSKYNVVEGNEDAIDATIDDIRKGLSFADVGILLETGDIYFRKGVSYSIFYENFAKELVVERNAAINLIEINGSEMMVFGIPIESSCNTGTVKISAICGFARPTSVNNLLSVKFFDGNGVTALYRDDGFSLATSDNASKPKNEDNFNFFSYLESQKSEEEFKQIEKDYLTGNSGLTSIVFSDNDYYVYYSKIHFSPTGYNVSDVWHLVIYVSEAVVFSNVNSIIKAVLTTLIAVFVFIIVVSIMLVGMFIVKRDNDIIMKKQLAANKLLENAADSAVEASHAKTVFLSNMSHDIRTPINGIICMTEIAKKHTDDEEKVRDCLSKIEGASSHLLSLVNDVLDMRRIESGKAEIISEPMNVTTAADECCSIVYGQLAERNVGFEFVKTNIVHPDVLGDKLHLKQILINILGNAVKFTPDGGKITFTVEELSFENDEAVYSFTVKDTGCGMSEEFLNVVFQPFSQENNTERTHYNGTGLGLSISDQLARLMGGNIAVSSKLNEGSEFVVKLPFKINVEKVPESAEKPADGEIKSFKGVKVLLVEDNELNSELEKVLLSEKGMVVETAENGLKALEAFMASSEYYYDCILMDVMMPEMDGITATLRIRSSDRKDAKTIPIIAITANAFEFDIRRTTDAGMNAHISKPFYVEEVLKVLGRLLVKKQN